MQANIKNFRMPRSAEIPAIGLYLDQVVNYVNLVFSPLGCVRITPSMVSNYVKKKYLTKPVRKQYHRDQLRTLMVIVPAKLVLGMDEIDLYLKTCSEAPKDAESYDEFCDKLEQVLSSVSDETRVPEDHGYTSGVGISVTDSLIIAIAMCIHLRNRLETPPE